MLEGKKEGVGVVVAVLEVSVITERFGLIFFDFFFESVTMKNFEKVFERKNKNTGLDLRKVRPGPKKWRLDF